MFFYGREICRYKPRQMRHSSDYKPKVFCNRNIGFGIKLLLQWAGFRSWARLKLTAQRKTTYCAAISPIVVFQSLVVIKDLGESIGFPFFYVCDFSDRGVAPEAQNQETTEHQSKHGRLTDLGRRTLKHIEHIVHCHLPILACIDTYRLNT